MPTKKAVSADNQQERSVLSGWVVGFTDGEGCFSVSIVRNKTTSAGWQVMPEFVVTQGESSLNALKILKNFFECGNIFVNKRYDNHTENLYRFCIRAQKDLFEKVIPFFKENPLQTAKRKQFKYFVQIMDFFKKGEHTTLKGITKIGWIASKMNVGKKRLILKSPEVIRQAP